MLQLETVEDFEKVDEALNNPASKLSEYCVLNYGYCGYCRSLGVYDLIKQPDHIYCRGCKNNFYPDQLGLSYLYYIEYDWGQPIKQELFEFRVGGDIPEWQGAIVRDFFSRKHQRELFNNLLEARIKILKSEQRALSNKVRQLAKLRSTRKSGSTR